MNPFCLAHKNGTSKATINFHSRVLSLILLLTINCTLIADTKGYKPNSFPHYRVATKIKPALWTVFKEREALFRAALFTIRPSYKNQILTCNDLKRIFTFAFTAVHMTDAIYFPLKNAYASVAYLHANPFSPDLIPGWEEQDYELSTLHQGSLRKDYFSDSNICNHTGKTLDEVMKQVIDPLYKDRLSQFKKWLSPDSFNEYTANLDRQDIEHAIGVLDYEASNWIFYERLIMIREAYVQSGLYSPNSPDAGSLYRLRYKNKYIGALHNAFKYPLDIAPILSALTLHTKDSLGLFHLERMLERLFLNLDELDECILSPGRFTALDHVANTLTFLLKKKTPPYGMEETGASYASIRRASLKKLAQPQLPGAPEQLKEGVILHKLAQLPFSELEAFSEEQAKWSKTLIEDRGDIQTVTKFFEKTY